MYGGKVVEGEVQEQPISVLICRRPWGRGESIGEGAKGKVACPVICDAPFEL